MENKVIYVPVSVQEEPPPKGDVVLIHRSGKFKNGKSDGKLMFVDCLLALSENYPFWIREIELPSEEEIKEAVNANYPNPDDARREQDIQDAYINGINHILSIINHKK